MKIKEALLKESTRLSYNGTRWLIMDEMYVLGGEFVVMECKRYARSAKEIYRGTDEDEAVAYLLDLPEEDEQDDYGYADQKNFD